MQIRRCQGVYPLPNIPLSSAADQLYVVKAVVKAWRSYQPKSGCGKFQSTGYGFVKALRAGFEFHWSWSASRLNATRPAWWAPTAADWFSFRTARRDPAARVLELCCDESSLIRSQKAEYKRPALSKGMDPRLAPARRGVKVIDKKAYMSCRHAVC